MSNEDNKELNNYSDSEMLLNNDESFGDHKMYFGLEDRTYHHNRERYESPSEDSFFNRTQYSLLLEYALTDGYEEYSTQKTTNNNGLITTVTSVVQGFLLMLIEQE